MGAVAALELDPTDPVIRVLRVRRIRSVPVMVTEAWVPTLFADQVTEEHLANQRSARAARAGGGVRPGDPGDHREVADPIRGHYSEWQSDRPSC